MNFEQWLEIWLRDCVRPYVKPRTWEKYAAAVKNRIVPHLGAHELEELSAFELQHFVSMLSSRYSASTVAGVVSVLNSSLGRAEEMGIRRGHCRLHYPRRLERSVQCFTPEEQRKIERHILERGDSDLFGVILCLYTGLRIGELFALEWKDLDLKNGFVSVTKTCRDFWRNGTYERETGTPKTETSNRIVPLPEQILPYLRGVKRARKGRLLMERNGRLPTIRAYQKSFEVLLKKLGIPHRGFHALRHTFATRALECGMDVRTLAEILGHKNPTVTLKRYAHSLPEHKKKMMNKIGKLFL